VRDGDRADAVAAAFASASAEAPLVRLTGDRLPEIKHVAHTSFCDIGWVLDATGRRLVVVAALDNLSKGAASQAVQAFNLAYGFDEALGLC
jgi:N-acetyl-gamma-glutamylphosphate reductase